VRTTEDAVRSLKRYLAVALGQPAAPLAAAKLFPNPDDADLSSVVESDVLYDHDASGALVTVGFATAGDAQAAGLVRTTTVGRTRFWASPPGKAWDGGVGHTVALTFDPYAVSPELVKGCSTVDATGWTDILSQERWGRTLDLVADSGAPYRCAMVVFVDPGQVFGGPGVAADAVAPPAVWDVRFFHDEGEFEYPVCIVKTVGAPTLVSNQNWYELTQAYVVYAYPTPPPSATGTASDAHIAAERVRQLLVDAFAAARADGARSMRIPLYDYDGTDPAMPAFHREQADYMRVVGASVDLQPEPNDPRQTVVVADLRLNWRVPVGEVPGRGIVRSVELTTTET